LKWIAEGFKAAMSTSSYNFWSVASCIRRPAPLTADPSILARYGDDHSLASSIYVT
jgi:hypothetical protein